MSAASGSAPMLPSTGPAPCVLPKVWPPPISATVSSALMPMRENVSWMSLADFSGSGSPSGPSGFT